MKYIKEREAISSDPIGIFLGCVYIFFTYLGSSIYLPSWLSRGTLLAFLAYGLLIFIARVIDRSFFLSHYSIWYGIIIFYTTISFSFSLYPSEIYSNHYYQLIVCFVTTLFLAEFITSDREFSMVCWSYVLSSLLMIILMYRNGNLVGNYDERLGNEVVGNANILATFLMYSVMYAIWLLIYRNYRLLLKIIISISIVADVYAIMLSAGRKFFVIPFIFLFVLLLMRSESDYLKNAIKYSLMMFLIVIVLYVIITRNPTLYNAIGVRIGSLINFVTGNGKADTSSIVRSQMRRAAIKGWKNKPIFGYGFNSFQYLRTPELLNGKSHSYSHCNYTELLYNGGIVYTVMYYAGFGYIIWEAITKKKWDRKMRAFALAAIISQFVLDYGGVFYDILTTQIFLLMATRSIEDSYSNSGKAWFLPRCQLK